jgi:hypothetical protein
VDRGLQDRKEKTACRLSFFKPLNTQSSLSETRLQNQNNDKEISAISAEKYES